MAEIKMPPRRKLRPLHPGELWQEILEDHLKLSVANAAERMGVTRQSLYAVLRGEAKVTAEMALRFGRLAGTAPQLYLNMQSERDLWDAEERLADVLKRIKPPAA